MARTMTEWIFEQGGTGTVNDRWKQYLTNQGHTTGTNPDKMHAWLSVTYTGTLQEMIKKWSDATLS